ncbi:MAG TPA: hypothetical protein VH254_03480 [Candidatus Udaeobacter sp.]|nr:hypothetical protein [Candidatus Udaeobacter sp.]
MTRGTVVWYMNNNIRAGSALGPTVPSGWSLIAPSCLEGVRKPGGCLAFVTAVTHQAIKAPAGLRYPKLGQSDVTI